MPVVQGISFAKRAIRQRASALWSDEGGSAVVEFSIVAPVFIAFLLGTLYIMLIYVAQQMLETAAEGAGRLLLTGTAQTSTLASGHVGMTAEDFLISAKAAAPHVADPDLEIGERIYRAVEATREAVGCNTNLGIVLLAVPLIHAAQHCMPGDILAHRLQRSLAALTRDDAEWVYRAIRLAAPGGLGESPRHDVRETPVVTLLEVIV